jgi:hypothetical protein
MTGSQRLLADGQRAPVERLGLRVAVELVVEVGERIERRDDAGVIAAAGLFAGGERAFRERNSIGVPAVLLEAGDVALELIEGGGLGSRRPQACDRESNGHHQACHPSRHPALVKPAMRNPGT